ncbi:hypothetical protein BDZ89DRAFT_269068 [Hymenopellis radicata]|nr:hypothetical protein BDZ89DRAFT_269068 [Hymenopellis radicata]
MLLCGVHRALVDPQSSHKAQGWLRSTLSRLGRVLFRKHTPGIRRMKMGIYDVALGESSSWNISERFSSVASAIPLFHRLIVDVFTLDPTLTTLYILSNIWNSFHTTVLLYTSTRLLKHIEIAIISGQPNTRQIVNALCIRFGFVLASAALKWASGMIVPRLTTRVNNHFNLKTMRGGLPLWYRQSSSRPCSSQFAHGCHGCLY